MLGLVAGPWLRAPALWMALATLIATRVVGEWPLPNDHIYLLAYRCLGVEISLTCTDSEAVNRVTHDLAKAGSGRAGIV